MSINLNNIVSRKDTNSVKWEFVITDTEREYMPMKEDVLSPEQHLPLWVADMDFRSPEPVVEALVDRARHGIFGYTSPTDSYYQTIINWMKRRHQWQTEQEWILTTPGVVPAICIAIQTFTEPGDKVLIQPPVYHPFFHAIENNHRAIARNSLLRRDGQYQMDFEDLARRVRDPRLKLAVLCSPHNPIGRVWSAEELRRFGQICYEHDVLVVADEIHHDLIMSPHTFTTYGVVNADLMDRAIVTTAPSKTFNLPGLKTSNAFIPNQALRQAFEETMVSNGMWGINAFGLVALETAYDQGEPWLEEVVAYIEDNYRFLCDHVSQRMPQIKVTELQATYLAWLDCRALGMDGPTLWKRLMDEAGVFFNEGSGFGHEGDGYMRLNLACARDVLLEALNRMAQFVNRVS